MTVSPKMTESQCFSASYNPDLDWDDFCIPPSEKCPQRKQVVNEVKVPLTSSSKDILKKGLPGVVRSVQISNVDSKQFLKGTRPNVSFMHLAAILNHFDVPGGPL